VEALVLSIKHLLSTGKSQTFLNNLLMQPTLPYASTAVIGIIPNYYVMDITTSYTYKWFKFSCSVNNISNNKYLHAELKAILDLASFQAMASVFLEHLPLNGILRISNNYIYI
jgi:hypothetical protein